MKQLYLIRHGQSLANTGAKSLPDVEIPLTALGQQQADELLNYWQQYLPSPTALYHSELLRAKQTAEGFCQHYALSAQSLNCLNEFRCLSFANIADMVGEQRAILAKTFWQTADINDRDGEDADCFTDFLARVDDFLAQAPHFPHHSVFFGHGIWIGLLAWRLLGCTVHHNADMQRFRQFQTALPMYNTVIYQLSIGEQNMMQLQHLPR